MTYPIQERGPGTAGLWIGSLLIVLGMVGGIALVVLGAKDAIGTVNHYQRVDVSTGGTVSFSKTGRYDAYYEQPGIRRRSEIPPIQVSLSGPGGSQTLDSDIGRTNSTEHYNFNDHEGVRLTRFDISTPGEYQVRLGGESSGRAGDQIAFGKGSITGGILSALGGFLGGGLVAFIGLIVLISTIVRRSRHRRRTAQAAYAGGYGYAAPGAWPPPAPPSGPGAPPGQWPPAGPTGPPQPGQWPGAGPTGPPQPGQWPGQPPGQSAGPPPGWAPPPASPQPPASAPGQPWSPTAPAAPPSASASAPSPGDDPNQPGWGGPGQ